MRELTRLIKEDMKPALGVTEPGAIAYAVASAKSHVDGEVKKVHVALNSGMYISYFTGGIPNSYRFGNLYAAALGAVAADAAKGLESLADITPEDDKKASKMVDDHKVEVVLDHIGSEITIDATVETETDSCTNIDSIEKNNEIIYQADADHASEAQAEDEVPAIHRYTLKELLQYVREVPVSEIDFIREAFSMNMDLLEEGIQSDRTTITRQLLKENGHKIISEDAKSTAQLLCNGAIEARVLGLSRPAMSITGSGAHGIIATMPLFAYYQVNYEVVDDDILLRAATLSYLITMYIKEYSGKLSAFCGCGIAAGTGMACALAFMRNADEEAITRVIQNMASGLTGMTCDGGTHLLLREPWVHHERNRGGGRGVSGGRHGDGWRMH